jgi:pilus assembly protein CpaB
MKRKLGGSLAALLLAVVGTVALVGYVQSAKDRAVAGERLVDVLVVTDAVAKGTPVSDLSGSVQVEEVPAKVKADGAVASLDALDRNDVAVTDLVAGEQVVASRFASPVAAADGRAAGDALTVTVSLAPERALGGNLQVGDTVAVLASFEPFDVVPQFDDLPPGQEYGQEKIPPGSRTPNTTHVILHKVPVTAIQADEQSEDALTARNDEDGESVEAPTTNLLVSLAVDAPSAERIVFAAEHGTLWLAAEPTTAPESGTKVVHRGNEYE